MSNIKSIKQIGYHQTYDLEVDHPDHQYYLSNGILTSNSHAVLYSFISFVTAYLKAHYPVEFLLANLHSEVQSNAPTAEANIDRCKLELKQRGVKILPPDLNKSEMKYHLLDTKTILTGLDALKFVGDDAIQDVLEKRPFKDFDDFMRRTDAHKMRAPAIQALAAAGCFDQFGLHRKLTYLYCSDYRKKYQVWLKKHDPLIEIFEFPWKQENEWSKAELYALEKKYLGEAFVCSKKEAFGNFFTNGNHTNLKTVKVSQNRTYLASIKAEIKSVFELKVKKEGSKLLGQDMAKVIIEDELGIQCGLTIFPDAWKEVKKKVKESKGRLLFEPGFVIHFAGSSNLYENEMGIILNDIFQIIAPPALPKDLKAKKMSIKGAIVEEASSSDLVSELEDYLFTEGLVNLDEDPFAVDI